MKLRYVQHYFDYNYKEKESIIILMSGKSHRTMNTKISVVVTIMMICSVKVKK